MLLAEPFIHVRNLAGGVALLVAAFALSGCGFQLRSYDLEGNIDNFAISGQTRAQVVDPLRRTLRQLGVEEVDPGMAAMTVHILDQRSERRSVSTAGQIRAAEYEVDYALQYELLDASGASLAAPTWIERRRVYRVDRDNIVGSSEEQAILFRELMQDVVGQIVRAMNLVSRRQPAADES